MSCPSFGSSSEVTLWYAMDPGPGALEFPVLADTAVEWTQIPMTGESITTNLSSTISDQITASRSYAGSKLTQGEITGSFNFEAQAGDFMYDMLISAMQADASLTVSGSGGSWDADEVLQNGSSKQCLTFLKRVGVAGDAYDWYVFRGVEISSLSLEIAPNALVTGTVNIMGIRPDDPIEAKTEAEMTNWTGFDTNIAPSLPLMSGVDSLKNFAITMGSNITDVTMQSVSINIDNQMRQQQAVGINSIYAAGIASGRFMVTLSGSAYYADPKVYNAFVDDSTLSITGVLLDSSNDGFEFEAAYCKVTGGSIPTADGPDQDLMIQTEFRAFESTEVGHEGTLRLTKRTDYVIS